MVVTRSRWLLHRAVPGAILAALLTTACDSSLAPQAESAPDLSRSVHAQTARDELLKSVRRATAPFHSTVQAIRAGYAPTSHCVAVPGLGGMGYHWVNGALVDPVFDPLQPEAVLYATDPDGTLRPVAIEYIVLDVGQPRPAFGGHLFDIGGAPLPVPHWTLHVWLYEENPAGLFTPFNPSVSCP